MKDAVQSVADQDDPGNGREFVHEQHILFVGKWRKSADEIYEGIHIDQKKIRHNNQNTELQDKAHDISRPGRRLVVDKQSCRFAHVGNNLCHIGRLK